MRRLRLVIHAALYVALGCACTCGGEAGSPQDDDNDGFTDDEDCDDDNSGVNPGERESCNGRDDDCDGSVDEEARDAPTTHPDADNDGFGDADGATWSCDPPAGYVDDGSDCDDQDPTTYPGATEYCDGEDDNCDGDEDDAVDPPTWFADADGDGFGDPNASVGSCDAPTGYLADDRDCDDTSATIRPGADEVCADGIDNDCEPATADTCTYAVGADPTATFLGQATYEGAGAALAGVGDVNGDGYDDLAIGAFGEGADPDGVYVVTGPASGTIGLAYADARLTGTDPDDAAGTSVAAAGDVDGDGYADVLVGAPDEAEGGAAWLWTGPNVGYGDADSARLMVGGNQDGDRMGAAVAGPGDVDGDGIDDLLLGAPGLSGGAAFLVSGTAEGTLDLSDAEAVFRGVDGEEAGSILASPGDVDGDGLADLAILDPHGGTVWVEWGGGWSGTVALADAPAILTAPAGGTLSSAAFVDLDGDGTLDVVIGETFSGDAPVDAVAWAEFGPLSGTFEPGDAQVSSEGVYANAGVVVAAKQSRGTPILVFAAPSASTLTDDGLLDVGGSVYVSDVLPASLGDVRTRYSGVDAPVPAFAGDLDHDGFEDLAVGDARDDRSGTDAGAVRVLGAVGR